MTKEEAKGLLDNLLGMVEDNQNNDYDKALRMGIKALEQEPCTDSVNRATVLTLINDVKNADGFKDYSQYEYLFDNVDKMPMSVPTQRWIPVSERLPEDGQRVFVTQTFERRTIVYCTRFPFDKTKEKYIIAWMPLPDGYKKEKESE